MSKSRTLPRRVQGFSLLEVLLAVTIAIGLGSMQLGQLKRDTENRHAQVVGEQLRMVGNALNSYVAQQYGHITSMTSVTAPGLPEDPGPRACNATTKICTITSDTLRRSGFLPASFSGRNAYGSTYTYYIRVGGASPNWTVDGVVVTTDPYSVGGAVRYDLVGVAMLSAGADSGTTRSVATQINGYNGSWLETGFPVNQLGLLAYRVGYGSSNNSTYLRVDGTLPMTGDLDLGGHNIKGVGDIQTTATGKVKAGQFETGAPNAAAIVLGSDNATDQTLLGNNGNRLKVTNTGGMELVNPTTGTYTDLVAGNITGTGNLTISGWGTFSGNLQSAGLRTTAAAEIGSTLYAHSDITSDTGFFSTNGGFQTTNGSVSALNGTISSKDLVVKNTGSFASDVSVGGKLTVLGDLGIGASGWHYNATANGNAPANSIQTLNNASLYSGGRVIAEGGVKTQANQTAGASCASQGAGSLAVTTSGQPLGCNGSIWVATSISTTYSRLGGQGTTSTATCDATDYVTGCSFAYISRSSPDDPSSPANVQVSGKSCIVTAQGAQYFQAVATCSR